MNELMIELITDALHLSLDEGQMSSEDYEEALFFVENGFSHDIYWTDEETSHFLSKFGKFESDMNGKVTDEESRKYLINRRYNAKSLAQGLPD